MNVWVAVILTASLAVTTTNAQQICGRLCDGDGAGGVNNPRVSHTETLFGRSVSILVSDNDNVVFARISNGDPGDEVWIDRSFNGGATWQGRIGNTAIPNGAREATTPVFNIDGNLAAQQIGVLRACGTPGDRDEIVCTPWARASVRSGYAAEAAATALMYQYNANGLWDTTGWWNAANCLTGLIDFMRVTGDRTYQFTIDNTFEKNRNAFAGNFCNDYIDDTGWWGLAWVDAFDLTGDQKYLQTAQVTCDYMYSFRDDRCGGGVNWSVARDYKNAITNELFIKLAAALHNRIPGDTKYLNWAREIYGWFENSGMINNENLVNDGLNTLGDCRNNGAITWTYNQGVILGALVQLNRATGDTAYLNRARAIADAAVRSSYISPNGILHEPCDHDNIDCGGDAPTFKGVFARNLGELNDALGDKPYSDYIRRNADTIHNNRNSIDQYGLHYEGPFQFFSAASQQSAFEMLVAAERLNRGRNKNQ